MWSGSRHVASTFDLVISFLFSKSTTTSTSYKYGQHDGESTPLCRYILSRRNRVLVLSCHCLHCHCSGAEEKQEWIKAVLSVGPLREEDSDAWPPPVNYLSGGPCDTCVFEDITTLFEAESKCCTHGGMCKVPACDVLCIGTSCKDISKMNAAQDRSQLVLTQASSRGASAQTFQGLKAYVANHRPLAVVYENVDAMSDQANSSEDSNLKVCLSEFEQLGYLAQPMMTDASEFGLPCRRRRIYILFINTRSPKLALLARSIPEVMTEFRQLVSTCTRSPPCASEVLLESDDPAVLNFLQERQERAAKAANKKASSKSTNWVNQHMKFADSLGVRWASMPGEEKTKNPWYQTLTEREADVLNLSEVEAPLAGFRNLSQSTARANSTSLQASQKHLAPTMLPGQILWTQLAQPQSRLVSGFEAMLFQGFPIVPCIARLTDEGFVAPQQVRNKKFPSDLLLQELAGNAMALPVVMSITQAALAAIWLRPAQLQSSADSVQTALDAMLMLTEGLRPSEALDEADASAA